MPYYHERSIR